MYILIEVYDREISAPYYYDTFEKARAEMLCRFHEVAGDDVTGEDSDSDCYVDQTFAWADTAQSDHVDWSIFKVPDCVLSAYCKASYGKRKESVRREAAEWQQKSADQNLSYEELAESAARFERLGRRYGLLREFRENGIC